MTGKKLESCRFGDEHVFKVYVHVPGTKNKRKTKNLKSRDIDEAIQEAIEFQRGVKQGHKMPAAVSHNIQEIVPARISHYLLSDAFARYIGWLNNENVPLHRQKELSGEHIKDVERAIKFCFQSLAKRGYGNIGVQELNDQVMGYLYEDLVSQNFKGRTINKYLGHLTSFLTWHMEEFKVPERNWFTTIEREYVPPPDPQTITQDEFERLLAESKKPGNGIEYYEHGSKLQRNYERPFVPPLLEFGILSGMRRENLLTARFNNVKEENGVPIILKVPNIKVNGILKLDKPETMRYIPVPITEELRTFLYAAGYKKYKATDNYIIAPEIKNSRTRAMSDLISRAFSHYYSKLNTGRELTFKNLRKTYATSLSQQFGGETAKIVMGYSTNSVMDKHYLDKEEISKQVAKTFKVFPIENNRTIELSEIRNKSNKNQIEMEVEK